MLIRLLIVISLLGATAIRAPAAEQSLGQAIKKIFTAPTPTPTPRKKKRSSKTKKESPSPSPTPRKKSSRTAEKESPKRTSHVSARKHTSPSPESEPEPSGSVAKHKRKISESTTPSASPHHGKKYSLTPEPFETPSPAPSSSPTPSPTPKESPPPIVSKKRGAPDATLTPDQIKGFENYPSRVQKLLASALELTARDLDYKYGSANPDNGGMDCSGFVYFVLKENGIDDVPRDSSEQYVWLRRARTFEAVLSRKEDSFELEDLKPGDLLFWTGTYSIERDPPITHAMIYLGREKKTGERVMVGASDGRVYHGESRYGVSVFDFKIHTNHKAEEGRLFPTFVGYGHIPGLRMQKSE
jgi:cell wall-associated NlpC family hydrolase